MLKQRIITALFLFSSLWRNITGASYSTPVKEEVTMARPNLDGLNPLLSAILIKTSNLLIESEVIINWFIIESEVSSTPLIIESEVKSLSIIIESEVNRKGFIIESEVMVKKLL